MEARRGELQHFLQILKQYSIPLYIWHIYFFFCLFEVSNFDRYPFPLFWSDRCMRSWNLTVKLQGLIAGLP